MGAAHTDRYDIGAIKRQVSVIDVVGADEPLIQRNKGLWVGEKHDSLHVQPDKGLWNWWSQSQGGDIFSWLMWRRNYGWHEAVRHAIEIRANPASVPLQRETGHVFSASQPANATLPKPPTETEALGYHHTLLSRPGLQAKLAHERGLDMQDIERWQIGYRPDHWGGGEAWSIPIYEHGALVNIRYRIWNPSGYWAKYLPHGKGLGIQLFNAETLGSVREVFVLEGEFKVMVAERYGLPAVGLMGCQSFKASWLPLFAGVKRCYILMDEGVHAADLKWCRVLARQCECLSVTVPGKPDDLLRACDSASIITNGLASARRIPA